MTIEELLTRAKRLRNDLDDSNARLDRQCVTAMYEMEQAMRSQAERIAEQDASIEPLNQLVGAQLTQLIALRAQLDALAATEPVAVALRFGEDDRICLSTVFDTMDEAQDYANTCAKSKSVTVPLFTRPIPAQDVNAELVEALEDLHRQYAEHPDAFWDWSKARTALSKYKGAK